MNKNKLILGLTGGIGSGKSRILSLLKERYGAVILEADQIAKQLQNIGQPGYDAMLRIFGKDILAEDGRLNRPYIAKIMFDDPNLISEVNAAIHPLVAETIKKEIESAEDGALIVLESAILWEAGLDQLCSCIIFVYTEKEVRIDRLMKDRGYTKEKCLHIMEQQAAEDTYREKSNYIIENNGDFQHTCREIELTMSRILLER